MKYKKLPLLPPKNNQIYQRIEDDGKVYVTCNGNNQDFKDWVAAGNTPEEAG
jgi:hypothetical protein